MKSLLLFLFVLNAYCQENIIEDDYIYIFTRSTKSKIGFIAEDFNIQDSLSTHIGIGFVEKGRYIIYNVDNIKKGDNNSSLIREDYSSFIRLSDLYYSSIWQFKANKEQKIQLIKIIKRYESYVISFDDEFELNNSIQNLYCSEFVYLVLKELKLTNTFIPVSKELTEFYKNILKKDFLEYIPVDFFQKLNYFYKVDSKFYGH